VEDGRFVEERYDNGDVIRYPREHYSCMSNPGGVSWMHCPVIVMPPHPLPPEKESK